jgi:DNA modification methylase
MCGDSTKLEDVQKLMDGKTADLLLTDPPYNVDIGIEDLEDAKARKRRLDGKSIQNDKMSDIEFYQFLLKAFQNAEQILKPGGAFYIWYASREVVNFENALKDAGLTTKQELIWNKNVFVMGRQDYQWKHEPCLYGWREGEAHYFINDRTQKTVIENEIDLDNMKKEDMRKLLEEILDQPTTVIDEKRPRSSKDHPTMKPIKLIAKQIRNSTRPGELVIDLFGGSGSTLIACEELKRTCYIMEYDPHYVDVIVQRWEEQTGQKAVLLNGKD